jgi:hypothetical protein
MTAGQSYTIDTVTFQDTAVLQPAFGFPCLQEGALSSTSTKRGIDPSPRCHELTKRWLQPIHGRM